MNFNEYSVVQLEKWLSVLGLPAQGLKSELMDRFARVSPEVRGQARNGGGCQRRFWDKSGRQRRFLEKS